MASWSLLGGDPAPGDPDRIEFRLRHLRRAEDAVRDVDDALRRISVGTEEADFTGLAAEALRASLGDFRYDLQPIADSFANVRGALSTYAVQLTDLQARARQALRRAEAADHQRQVSEADRAAAASLLSQQQSQLRQDQAALRTHELASLAHSVLDPGAAASDAQESARLGRNVARSQRSVADTSDRVRRLSADVSAAMAAVQSAQRDARTIHEEWEDDSRRAARLVHDGLVQQLRNKSNVEKFFEKVASEVGDIQRFLEDPLHNISVLRKWIDRFHALYSTLSTVLEGAAFIAALVGLEPLAAALEVAAKVMAISALALMVAKFALDAVLWGNHYTEGGHELVTTADLGLDGIDLAFDAVDAVVDLGPASDSLKAPLLAGRLYRSGEHELARDVLVAELKKKFREKVAKKVVKDALEKGVRLGFDPSVDPTTTVTCRIPSEVLVRPLAPATASGGGGW